MTYDVREQSTCAGEPYECFWFTCGPSSYRITSGQKIRVVNGMTFLPAPFKCGQIGQNQELRSGQVVIEVPIDHEVALLFRKGMPLRPVSLVLFRGHDGEPEVVPSFTGMVAARKLTEICELTVVPEQDALKKKIPALRYQHKCPRRIFSPRCTLRRQDWEVFGSIISVSGRTIRCAAFATKPNGWFNGGWIEDGRTAMAIVSHLGDTVTLFYELDGLQPGVQIVAYPGCEGTEECCRDKFGNLPNHLGWRRIPFKNPFGSGGIA